MERNGKLWTGGRGGAARVVPRPVNEVNESMRGLNMGSGKNMVGNMQEEHVKDDMMGNDQIREIMKREIWGEAVDPSLRRKEVLIEKLRAHVWKPVGKTTNDHQHASRHPVRV
eukprot:765968-Hanusia_phi.AAC.1